MDTTTGSVPAAPGTGHKNIELPGVSLHILESGTGTPLLLLHGVPQDSSSFKALIPTFARTHRVIAPDLRGFGQSSMPTNGYSLEVQIADLINLLDALDMPRTRIIGHDLGALFAILLCLKHPERVISLVTLSIPHPFLRFNIRFLPLFRAAWFEPVLATPGLATLLMGRGNQPLARFMFSHYAQDSYSWNPQIIEYYLELLRRPGRASALGSVVRSAVLPTFIKIMSGAYLTQRLSTPTLVAVGEEDSTVPFSLLEGFESHADAMELLSIPGASHFALDEQPELVLAAAQEFFAKAGH